MSKKNTSRPFREFTKHKEDGLSFERIHLERECFTNYWNYHPEIELTFTAQGHGMRYIGDYIGPFQANELVMIGSYLPHDYVSSMQSDAPTSNLYVIKFKPDLFAGFVEFEHLKPFFEIAKRGLLFTNIKPQTVDLLMKVYDENKFDALLMLFKLVNHLKQVPYKVLSKAQYNVSQFKDTDIRLQRAFNFIHERHHQSVSLVDIAKFCSMEPHSFSRWFRKFSGVNFLFYLNKVRVSYACQALNISDKPIKNIAFECGFSSLSTFERVFKKYTKITPSEYKRRLKNPFRTVNQ